VVEHLYDGYGYTFVDGGSVGSGTWLGTAITFRRGGQISGLRYHRLTTTTTPPSQLELWKFENHVNPRVLVETVILVVEPTQDGWCEALLSAPVDVFPGEMYFAVGTSTGAWSVSRGPNTGFGSVPWTLSQGVTDYTPACNATWTGVLGTTFFDPRRYGLDLIVEPEPFGDFTVAELTDEFERWLTAGGDKYPDSDLPAIKSQATGANTNASNAWETAQEVQTDLGQFRDEWPGTLAAALQGGLTTIGDWLTTESDWYQKLVNGTAPWMANLTDAVGAYTGISALSYLADLIRWANGVNQQPQLADTSDWELLDETDFTDNLLWPVEADVYRVTLSAFDPAGTSEPVGTETRHAYLGKWCSFNVQFSSEWRYFNTASADLYSGGRMPGLGLILQHGGAGHVQAWRRAEAP